MSKFIIPVLAAATLLCACKQEAKDPYPQATQLFAQANKAYNEGNFDLTLQLLDSLDHSQKAAVDLRRQGMPLRAKAIEGAAASRLPEIQQQISAAEQTIQALSPMMTALPGTEFDVPKAWPGRGDILAQGIEPRVQRPEGFFRLAVKCKPIGLSRVEFQSGADVVSSKPLPADRVATTEGTELASLGPEEYAPLGQWLSEHAQQPVTVVLVGRRGKWQQKLSAAQVAAIDQSYTLSTAVVQMFELQKEYDRLQRTLEIARKQSNK